MFDIGETEAEAIKRRVDMFSEFAQSLRTYYSNALGELSHDLRRKLNHKVHAVLEVVTEAGCLHIFAVNNAQVEPFLAMFMHEELIPHAIDMCDQAIGVIQGPGYLA